VTHFVSTKMNTLLKRPDVEPMIAGRIIVLAVEHDCHEIAVAALFTVLQSTEISKPCTRKILNVSSVVNQ
jgi:hypothetical protein